MPTFSEAIDNDIASLPALAYSNRWAKNKCQQVLDGFRNWIVPLNYITPEVSIKEIRSGGIALELDILDQATIYINISNDKNVKIFVIDYGFLAEITPEDSEVIDTIIERYTFIQSILNQKDF